MVEVAKRRIVVERSIVVHEAKCQAVEAYRALKEFKVEIIDSTASTFIIGFDHYKAQVAHAFLVVGVNQLNLKESEETKVKEDTVHSRATLGMGPKVEEGSYLNCQGCTNGEHRRGGKNLTTPLVLASGLLEVPDDKDKEGSIIPQMCLPFLQWSKLMMSPRPGAQPRRSPSLRILSDFVAFHFFVSHTF